MKVFFIFFKRRFLRVPVYIAIGIGLLSLIIGYLVRSYPLIQYYYSVVTHQATFTTDYRDAATNLRSVSAATREAQSFSFSFFIFMHYGFTVYLYLANILIVIPVILFYEELKSGYSRFVLTRISYKKYIIYEVLGVSFAGWLIAFIPCFIYWLCASLFSPDIYPLNQTFSPDLYDIFKALYNEANIKFLYLFVILLNSLSFFFKTFLVFIFCLFIKNKPLLYFIPLIFSYVSYTLFRVIGIEEYANITYFNDHFKSLTPMLFSFLFVSVIALLVFKLMTNKEKSLNV